MREGGGVIARFYDNYSISYYACHHCTYCTACVRMLILGIEYYVRR